MFPIANKLAILPSDTRAIGFSLYWEARRFFQKVNVKLLVCVMGLL